MEETMQNMQQPPMGEPTPASTPETPGAPVKKGRTVAILGVVFGLIAIAIGFIPLIGFLVLPLAIAGLILGIIGVVKDSKPVLHWFGLVLPILSFIVIFVIAPVLARKAIQRGFQDLQEAGFDVEVNFEEGNFGEFMQDAAAALENLDEEDFEASATVTTEIDVTATGTPDEE